MSSVPRMTMATRAVLRVLLADPSMPRYGFDIAGEAGVATGSLYPILARLEQLGWLESFWEDIAELPTGRPRRRYYKLSETGALSARAAIETAERRMGSRVFRPSAGVA